MPSAKYTQLQDECYAQSYATSEARLARRRELRQRFDPCDVLLSRDAWMVWATRDNRLIPVAFMRESHLRNAYRQVYGELAQYVQMAQRGEYDRIDLERFEGREMQLSKFKRELKRRKLPTPPDDPDIETLAQRVDRDLHPDYDRDLWDM